MPKLVHAVSGLPPAAVLAYEAVRSPTRILMVGWLASNPESHVRDIVGGIGGERELIRRHLIALEKIGVVTASHPPEERAREWVKYSVDLSRWQELISVLSNYPALDHQE